MRKVIDELLANCRKLPGNLRNTPLVRDLKRRVDITKEDDWTYYSEITADNPVSIIAGTRWARDDSDLAEAANAAFQFIQRVTGWSKGLTQLGALWELVELEHDPQRQTGLRFTELSKNTRRLMSDVAAGTVAKLEQDGLVEQLERQTGWYRSFAEAWELRAKLVSAGGAAVAAAAKNVPLEALDSKARRFWLDTPEKQEKLETRLAMLATRLEQMREQSNEDPASADVTPVAIPSRPAEMRAEELRSPVPTQATFGDDPLLALSITAASAPPALDPAPAWQEDTSENAALAAPAGGADIDGEVQAAPTLIGRVLGVAVRLYRRARGYVLRSRLLFWLRLSDLLVSGAIVLVSSIVYTATLYNKDWGTVADCVAAFGAGFVGHVTVNWGLLPIYRSIRLRANPATGGNPAGDVTPASLV
jgi:hypothetical protein